MKYPVSKYYSYVNKKTPSRNIIKQVSLIIENLFQSSIKYTLQGCKIEFIDSRRTQGNLSQEKKKIFLDQFLINDGYENITRQVSD